MENKQTAVEWLADKMVVSGFLIPQTFVEQAKQMEKEQIMIAFWNGDNSDWTTEQNAFDFAKDYYNETYKQ